MWKKGFDDGRAVFPSLRKKTNVLPAGGKVENHSGYNEFLSEASHEHTSKVMFTYRKKTSISE